jgi:hypothetical protein
VDQRRRSLDVGEKHRDEARRREDRFVSPALEVTLGLQLVGDEPDGHDLELPRGDEESLTRPVTGGFVLERDLVQAGERVADVVGIVDREPTAPAGIDVGEGAVGKP